MASTYLTKTFASSGTSDKIATFLLGVKRSRLQCRKFIITAGASLTRFIYRFESSGDHSRVRLWQTDYQI